MVDDEVEFIVKAYSLTQREIDIIALVGAERHIYNSSMTVRQIINEWFSMTHAYTIDLGKKENEK